MRYEVKASVPLTGELDVEALIAAMPESCEMRGMFFRQLIADLGDDFANVAPRLVAPPAAGKYSALGAYSARDFIRLFSTVARRTYPDCSRREAHRLRARADVGVFARSLMGKAMLSIVDNPATALLRYPEAIRLLSKGPKARATRAGANAVNVEFTNYYGSTEYMLGILEGIVMLFKLEPHIEVELYPPGGMTFLVRW